MSTDLDGYDPGVPYPTQFKDVLTPGSLAGVAALAGFRPPPCGDDFRLLDIGCGDGFAPAVVAASHPGARCEGLDGDPGHVRTGRERIGPLANLSLACRTFAEALVEGGPPCDYIVAQGIVAWVSPDVRRQVYDLAAARLAPGGLFAVGYNAMPGWSMLLAFQRLVRQFADLEDGDGVTRFLRAFARIRALAGPALAAVPAALIGELAELFERFDAGYLPHEYLAGHFEPQWSADVRRALEARGLVYVGQAWFDRTRPDLTLRATQREAVARETDPARRETLVDLLRDTRFRIDVFTRDPIRDPQARAGAWFAAEAGADGPFEYVGPAGRLRFDNPAARWLLEALQARPSPLAELREASPFRPADVDNALDCLLIAHRVRPCAPLRAMAARGVDPAVDLNHRIARAARDGAPAIRALAGRAGPVRVSDEEAVAWASGVPSARLARLGVPASGVAGRRGDDRRA